MGYVICASNRGYPASLEVGKVYRTLPDAGAALHGELRVVDEEGEDAVVLLLATDEALPEAKRDHALTGPWKDHRDCHVRPDLVLIYRKPDKETLQLVRLGSHHELLGI